MKEIDKDWFMNSLRGRKQSLRALARHLGMDPASLSRTFAGRRRMQMSEAESIALFLGVTTEEVMERAGVRMPSRVAGDQHSGVTLDEGDIVIAAEIAADGTIRPVSQKTEIADYVVHGLLGVVSKQKGKKLVGAVVKDASGYLALLDDALMLFSPGSQVTDRSAGTLAIIEPRGATGKYLARIERARKSGTMTIRRTTGEVIEVEVITATPIEMIYP